MEVEGEALEAVVRQRLGKKAQSPARIGRWGALTSCIPTKPTKVAMIVLKKPFSILVTISVYHHNHSDLNTMYLCFTTFIMEYINLYKQNLFINSQTWDIDHQVVIALKFEYCPPSGQKHNMSYLLTITFLIVRHSTTF